MANSNSRIMTMKNTRASERMALVSIFLYSLPWVSPTKLDSLPFASIELLYIRCWPPITNRLTSRLLLFHYFRMLIRFLCFLNLESRFLAHGPNAGLSRAKLPLLWSKTGTSNHTGFMWTESCRSIGNCNQIPKSSPNLFAHSIDCHTVCVLWAPPVYRASCRHFQQIKFRPFCLFNSQALLSSCLTAGVY